ncbi:hypothetical protein [Croceibacterium aestuarii]|uniref:hypothetical protein n=1 Tax=Croceibacterium aestuarii TaxID=3064139 RepID=UPI00272E3F6F|nr:hypothetical protein [Croceibacterium sp. D39]
MNHPIARYSDLWFRMNAPRAEELLLDLARGWQPPLPTSAELDEIHREAMRAIAILPDPYEYAMQLPPELADELRQAFKSKKNEHSGEWRISGPFMDDCFAWGLCTSDGFLGTFGIAVRREIMADEE